MQTAGSYYNNSIITSHFHSCMISCISGSTAKLLLRKSEFFVQIWSICSPKTLWLYFSLGF